MSYPITSSHTPPATFLPDDDAVVQAAKPKASKNANSAADYLQMNADGRVASDKNTMFDDVVAPQNQDDAAIAGASKTLGGLDAEGVQADLYSVMAAFQKFAQTLRTTSLQTRFSESKAQQNSLLAAAQKIRDGATERLVGAFVGGALQIGSGALQLSSAAAKGGKLEAVTKDAAALDVAKDNLGAQDKLLKTATKELDDATKVLANQKEALSKLPEVENKVAELEAKVGGLTQAKKELESVTKDLASQKEALSKLPDGDKKIAELDAKVSELKEVTKELDDVTKDLATQKSALLELQEVEKKIPALETKVSELTQAKNDIDVNRTNAHEAVKDAQDTLKRSDHALDTVGKRRAAMAEVSSGVAGMTRATADRVAAEREAEKAELEADASVHGAASQQGGDTAQAAQDMLRDSREKLGAMEQSRSDTARNIARM